MLKTPIGCLTATLLCAGFSDALADDRVGNPLLRQIAEAVALTKVCPGIETDDERIAELMQQAKLSQASVSKAVDETVDAIGDVAPATQLQSAPCSLALARYGPQGTLLAGLVRATKAASAPARPEVPVRKVKTVKIPLSNLPQ